MLAVSKSVNMGAYNSTADVSADVFKDYAPTDSGQRPKNFDYYNGTRLCMIPVGLYPHYRRGWFWGGYI
jgi:hypothetical protein